MLVVEAVILQLYCSKTNRLQIQALKCCKVLGLNFILWALQFCFARSTISTINI
ncbi:hypothetical protein VPHK469_0227 [Vibrio phage K469]